MPPAAVSPKMKCIFSLSGSFPGITPHHVLNLFLFATVVWQSRVNEGRMIENTELWVWSAGKTWCFSCRVTWCISWSSRAPQSTRWTKLWLSWRRGRRFSRQRSEKLLASLSLRSFGFTFSFCMRMFILQYKGIFLMASCPTNALSSRSWHCNLKMRWWTGWKWRTP